MSEKPERGRARDLLVRTARQMLVEARFADVASFITVRALTERTGLSNGAIYGAFRSGPASASGLTAPTAAARAALREAAARTREAQHDDAELERLAEQAATGDLDPGPVLAAQVERWGLGELADEFTLILLSALVARTDDGVRADLWEHYRQQLGRDTAVVRDALTRWGREPADGVTAEDLAAAFIALTDGLSLRARAQGEVPVGLVRTVGDALVEGMTVPVRGGAGPAGGPVPAPPGPLPPAQEASVVAAVRTLYDRGGWAAVDLAAVARRSGVEPGRLRRAHPRRELFAEVVWERLVDTVMRMAVRVESLPAAERATWLVHQLAEVVAGNRGAAAALTVVTAPTGPGEGPEPRVVAVLEPLIGLLGPVVESDPGAFGLRPDAGPVGDVPRARAVAAFALSSVLMIAVAQPSLEAAEVAEFVLSTCLGAPGGGRAG